MNLFPLSLYRVSGHSMQPTLQPGDTLLGWRWFTPRVGQVVVAESEGRAVIKRIVRVTGNDIFLQGDNASDSRDSRHFGAVPRAQVEARIIVKLG